MNNKAKFLPVDLGHLQEKAQAVVNYFNNYNNHDRSPEYREEMLRQAENVAKTLVRDFSYYFDKYEIGGMIPYNLLSKSSSNEI